MQADLRDIRYQRERAEYLLDRIAELGGPVATGGTVASARLQRETDHDDAGPLLVETHTYLDASGNVLGSAVWRARSVGGAWERVP